MKLGNLVQILPEMSEQVGSRFTGLAGIIIRDHSPMRPPDVGRVFDVMWNDGDIEDMYSDELEVIDEAR